MLYKLLTFQGFSALWLTRTGVRVTFAGRRQVPPIATETVLDVDGGREKLSR
jgi:hypothetical protein